MAAGEPGVVDPKAGGDETRWVVEPGTRSVESGARLLVVVAAEFFLCLTDASEMVAGGDSGADRTLEGWAPSPLGEGTDSSLTCVDIQPSSETPFCTAAKYPSSRNPSLPPVPAPAPSRWLRVDSE